MDKEKIQYVEEVLAKNIAGAGPIATVIQDTVSVLIYGLIASAIIL